jgi:hypothetical protein
MKSITEIEEPRRVIPYTATDEPSRENARRDRELPI